MGLWVFLGFVAFSLLLVLWARRVFRKHEEEAIYDTDSAVVSHSRDPAFLERLGDGFHGGSGPGL